MRISGIPKRGTHCLQNCNRRHFTWMENELSLSNLRKTCQYEHNNIQATIVWQFYILSIPWMPSWGVVWAVWSTPAMWINLILNMTSWQVQIIYISNFNSISLAINCSQSVAEHIQKPWNMASAFHFNYLCQYDYTSGLKTSAAKFLADLPLGQG